MTDLPKRRVRLSLDLQADSWEELRHAWSAIEFRLFGEQTDEAPVQVVSGGVGSGHVLSVTVNRDQTAAGYQRDLAAYMAGGWQVTAPRYVGRFLPMIQSGGDCVIVLADSSSCEYVGVRIESDVRGTDRYTIARMVAAALNAYNQPQEQEQKQEVPK